MFKLDSLGAVGLGFFEEGFDATLDAGIGARGAVHGLAGRRFDGGFFVFFIGLGDLGGLLHLLEKLFQLLVDGLGLVFEFGEIEFDAGELAKAVEDGLGSAGIGDADGEIGQFAEEAQAAESAFGAGGEEQAIEAADLPAFQQFHVEILDLAEGAGIGGGGEDARLGAGLELGGHSREGEEAFGAATDGVIEHALGELVAAGGGLGFADEDEQVVLSLRVAPLEKQVVRQACGLGQAVADFDGLELEIAGGVEFPDAAGAQLLEEVAPGHPSDGTHARPDRHQPRVSQIRCLGHDGLAPSARFPGRAFRTIVAKLRARSAYISLLVWNGGFRLLIMLKDVLRQIAVSGPFKEEVFATTRELYEIERPFAFDAFERSGRYCFEKLQEAGLDEAELLEFVADGRSTYWDKRLPPAWYPQVGRLAIVSGRGEAKAAKEEVIADYQRNPLELAMWSAATPAGGVRSEIISETMMLTGHSAEGRLVLLEPHQRTSASYRAVADRGGIGIISDFVKDPFVTPDAVCWMNAFRETPGWYPGWDDRPLLGFCITPRIGKQLREMLVRGPVGAKAEVIAQRGAGKLFSPTGLIRGGELPQEEIWMVAHTCEPLATDNSAGAAVTLMCAKVLSAMIRAGKLERPRRSIRFLFGLELYGTTAALKTLMERGSRPAATIVIDTPVMTPTPTTRGMHFYMSPAANPLFSDRVLREVAESCLAADSEVWRVLNGDRKDEAPQWVCSGGYLGNDAFLGDPMVGGPSFHLAAGDGAYWHNSKNTMDLVSADQLAVMVPLHAGLAHHLASLGPGDAPAMAEVMEVEGRETLAKVRRAIAEGKLTREQVAKRVAFELQMIGRRFEDARRWTGGSQAFAAAQERVEAFAQQVLHHGGAEGIDPFAYEIDQLDKVDRRAATAIFSRTEPTFPMSQAFVPDRRERQDLPGGLNTVLARMDGKKHLLRLIEEEEHAKGQRLDRKAILRGCKFLARHGYLNAEFTEQMTKADFVAALRSAGVHTGDLIFVHSSVSAFGHVEGGVEAMIDALLEAVGPKGTLLVPTFTHGIVSFDGCPVRSKEAEAFHKELKGTWLGTLPDAFLHRAGLFRSEHPSHSVAGVGPLAEACLKEHRCQDPPTGATSAFAKLVEHGGKVVYLGTSVRPSTFLHYMETKLELPYLADAVCRVKDERDGQSRSRLVLVPKHLPGHRRLFDPTGKTRSIFDVMKESGLVVHEAKAGPGDIHVIDAREFERHAERAIRADPAILLCEQEDCFFCRTWRQRIGALRTQVPGRSSR